MSAVTLVHTKIIDIFDEIITFSYAYEWQKLQNDSIDKLHELEELTSIFIDDSPKSFNSLPLFSKPEEKKGQIIYVLDKLNQAINNNISPQYTNFGDDWLNLNEMHFVENQKKESISFMLVPSSRNTSDNLYKQRFTNISPAKRLCQGLIEEFNKSKDTLIQNFS